MNGADQAGQGREPPLRPDWRDVLALMIATFQLLLPVLLVVAGALVLVLLVLMRMAR